MAAGQGWPVCLLDHQWCAAATAVLRAFDLIGPIKSELTVDGMVSGRPRCDRLLSEPTS